MITQNAKYWLCQITGWGAFALINIVFAFWSEKTTIEGIIGSILFIVFGLLATHLLRMYINAHGWKQLPLDQLIPRVLVAIVLCVVLLTTEATAYSYIFEKEDFKTIYIPIYAVNVFIMITGWCLAYFIWTYVVRNRRLQIEKLQMESAVKTLELNNIKANLQPHFIFNSLNSIRSLVNENPQKARDAITQLSNILRSSITADKNELVPISKEIDVIKDYLALEKIRFEDRLKLNYSVEESILNFQIPNLLIQTIVENAIKHGVAQSETGGQITISVAPIENYIYVSVTNTGQLRSSEHEQDLNSSGFGIHSSRLRLQYHFGEEAKIELRNQENNLVETLIKIPYNK